MAEADTVLAIHPSTDVRGTVRSASTAQNESFPDADSRILDTCTVGGIAQLTELGRRVYNLFATWLSGSGSVRTGLDDCLRRKPVTLGNVNVNLQERKG